MSGSFEMLVSGLGLLEAPVLEHDGSIAFSDVTRGGVWRFSGGEAVEVFPHRRGIGGMAVHEEGGLIVSGRNVAYKSVDRETQVLLEGNLWGYNDMVPDRTGRLYVGAFGFNALDEHPEDPPSGSLYLVDLDGTVTEVDDDVILSNGVGINSDGTTLYLCDSGRHVIYSYRISTDGTLHERKVFASVPEGILDGLAVAEDESIWVAVYGTGEIRVFDTGGKETSRLEVPGRRVSSLCFGGSDLRDLYVTTGSDGKDETGSLFRTRVEFPGIPPGRARIPLNTP